MIQISKSDIILFATQSAFQQKYLTPQHPLNNQHPMIEPLTTSISEIAERNIPNLYIGITVDAMPFATLISSDNDLSDEMLTTWYRHGQAHFVYHEKKSSIDLLSDITHELEHAKQDMGIDYTAEEYLMCIINKQWYIPARKNQEEYQHNYVEIKALLAELQMYQQAYNLMKTQPWSTEDKQCFLESYETLVTYCQKTLSRSMLANVHIYFADKIKNATDLTLQGVCEQAHIQTEFARDYLSDFITGDSKMLLQQTWDTYKSSIATSQLHIDNLQKELKAKPEVSYKELQRLILQYAEIHNIPFQCLHDMPSRPPCCVYISPQDYEKGIQQALSSMLNPRITFDNSGTLCIVGDFLNTKQSTSPISHTNNDKERQDYSLQQNVEIDIFDEER